MKFDVLFAGELIRRYKRFLADIKLDSGELITAHTANTGAMIGCSTPGSRVWLSRSDNPKRKYPYTWELVEVASSTGTTLAGINTMLSNALVKEAIQTKVLSGFNEYPVLQSEVKYGRQNSRIDLLLKKHDASENLQECCYVEVKNVTLVHGDTAYFPDAVSARATKHLQELQYMVTQGARAAVCFCVPRNDVTLFKPAAHIDSVYANTLQHAHTQGVEVYACKALVSAQEILLHQQIPVCLTQ